MCEYCLQSICPPGCPNHKKEKARYYCSICGQPIIDGEEYIQNADDEYVHFECIGGIRQLLHWLGYEIKEMGDFNYYG